MNQAPLPVEYTELSDEEVASRIESVKQKLGDKLVILGHHYQRDEIVRHADYLGDSYKLAKDANFRPQAEVIVFCGVHFMAESADILTPDSQSVVLPNLAAGCSMADMAGIFQVKNAWKQLAATLGEGIDDVVPITYINSAANLKAFVGDHGGTVCTSSNAPAALKWALSQGRKVLFFPDQHLGRNTAFTMGFDPATDMVVWDPFKPLGGSTAEQLRAATFILWKGHCSVHTRFNVGQIEAARAANPQVRVLVHPECPLEVVRASDLYGSTEFIVKTIREAEAGSAWAIGTEINLVKRLAAQNPDKSIVCLDAQICPCATMYRIHPSFLLWSLDRIQAGEIPNIVKVPDDIKSSAKIALDQMLALPA